MSKRAGEFVALDDLIDEIGVDAARWFLLARSHDTTLDLDLDLARSESSENPVYYVQYAHARIASVLAKAGEERVAAALRRRTPPRCGLGPPSARWSTAARASRRRSRRRPTRRAPHRIAAYSLEPAQAFTAFYRDCQVVGVEPARARDLPAAAVRRDAAPRSPARWACSGSPRRTRCSGRFRRGACTPAAVPRRRPGRSSQRPR